MTALSIAVWGVGGLTWPLWKPLVAEIEPLGFAGHYFIDALPHGLGVYTDSLEAIPALTYLADHTQRVQIGTAITLMPARDPVTLARQAIALDDLSGGRFMLGVGAGGGQTREAAMFGYTFGDIPTRMDRLEEGLHVITSLLHSSDPVTFKGRFYQLEEALLIPKPQRSGGPPVLVSGAGVKRSLPLVARYGDIWSPQTLPPEVYRERAALLDDLLRAEGRSPGAVKRTISLRVSCGRTPAEFEQRVSWIRGQVPMLGSLPLYTLLGMMRAQFGVFVGSPEEVVEYLRSYVAAGAEEIILEWTALDDIAGIQLIAEEVMPNI
jgi:alkanesulfonate monooxygenase SsuD/methylene tetrahydromethanopterin reductase-like flavin-dependent oxidoreductase (luciferase family)